MLTFKSPFLDGKNLDSQFQVARDGLCTYSEQARLSSLFADIGFNYVYKTPRTRYMEAVAKQNRK